MSSASSPAPLSNRPIPTDFTPALTGRKKSLRLRRKAIGWDDNARMALLGLTPL
jgi:hypothetical protein